MILNGRAEITSECDFIYASQIYRSVVPTLATNARMGHPAIDILENQLGIFSRNSSILAQALCIASSFRELLASETDQ